MDDALPAINISALQHVAYCPRQFALIHVEQAWEENYWTAHGRRLHQRVDSGEAEQRKDTRFERGIALFSHQYNLSGKLDLLEIEEGPSPRYFPVEYKRGKPKLADWDRVQLCAQALCIEEMRETPVSEGAIWYWEVRKRESVAIDQPLRQLTIAAINTARKLLTAGTTPPPIEEAKRCKACSLIDLCEPDSFRNDHSSAYIRDLFNNEKTA